MDDAQNKADDFFDLIETADNQDNSSFKLTQVKLVHSYFNDGDKGVGAPFETSVELVSNYDYEIKRTNWIKIVSHSYYDFSEEFKIVTASIVEELNDVEFLIDEISKINLRNLKNNYFSDSIPESLSHWELFYNFHFKIVGTFDQETNEFRRISKLLNLDEIIKSECDKISKKII